jgi:hypothetical protein
MGWRQELMRCAAVVGIRLLNPIKPHRIIRKAFPVPIALIALLRRNAHDSKPGNDKLILVE